MAPEQIVDPKKVDQRTDIYALGMVLYEMLTGHRPAGTVKKPSELNPTVPAWFDEIVFKMMEQKPEDRPASVLVIWATLERLARQQTQSSPQPAAGSSPGGLVGVVNKDKVQEF